MLIYEYINTPIYYCTNMLIYEYTDTQIYEYAPMY